jgi:hypothetical protein
MHADLAFGALHSTWLRVRAANQSAKQRDEHRSGRRAPARASRFMTSRTPQLAADRRGGHVSIELGGPPRVGVMGEGHRDVLRQHPGE